MPPILFFDTLMYSKKDHYTPLLHATIAEEASNYSNDMTADLISYHDPEIQNKIDLFVSTETQYFWKTLFIY